MIDFTLIGAEAYSLAGYLAVKVIENSGEVMFSMIKK